MKRKTSLMVVLCFCCTSLLSQNLIKGVVKSAVTELPLSDVTIRITSLHLSTTTHLDGYFSIKSSKEGSYKLQFFKEGYEPLTYSIEFTTQPIDLGTLFLHPVEEDHFQLGIITLSDDELESDTSSSDNVTGLLQASRDVFLRTAAFDFSNSFFKVRGLDSKYGKVLINGVEMNKQYNGKPLWSNWGGLNHLTNNQEFQFGLSPSQHNFGSLLGTTNITVRPSELRNTSAISYANSNRSYSHRVMGTHISELQQNWHIAFSLSSRYGKEGYIDGTFYKSYSFLGAVEKVFNDQHSLSITAIIAPNRRGRSTAITQEVYDLKGHKYNPYWGYQYGKRRNSRYREASQPILMIQYFWRPSEQLKLTNSFTHQFGHLASSRIDYSGSDINPNTGFPEGGGRNPDPSYYQKLPSYALKKFPNNLGIAYGLEKAIEEDGQLDWDEMITANLNNKTLFNGKAIYIQYEDKTKDLAFQYNAFLNYQIRDDLLLTAGFNHKYLSSTNFANIVDLLGGSGYLDIHPFANDFQNYPEQAQNNLLQPNNIVVTGEPFKYHYKIESNSTSAFSQIEFKHPNIDYFLAVKFDRVSYLRHGFFKNGRFEDSSYGKGQRHQFLGSSIKGGVNYKPSGRHLFQLQTAYLSEAPTLQNTYINPRENDGVVPNLKNGKTVSMFSSYTARLLKLKASISAYYILQKDLNEVSYFFADGIGGDSSAFVQEVLQGIQKQYLGTEIGIEYQLTSSFSLKGVAAIGQHYFSNNPNLFVSSDQFINQATSDTPLSEFGIKKIGQSYLKNYFLSNGPQQAYSLGFDYKDPDYWWVGVSVNHLSKSFVDINSILRSDNFYKDRDNLPFVDYDPEKARELLKQEELPHHLLVNFVGGKSWKINQYYISLFGSVSNVLNQTFKTGGFEQGRNANYRELLEDTSLKNPLFGTKYWFGRGTSYFVNLTIRL